VFGTIKKYQKTKLLHVAFSGHGFFTFATNFQTRDKSMCHLRFKNVGKFLFWTPVSSE